MTTKKKIIKKTTEKPSNKEVRSATTAAILGQGAVSSRRNPGNSKPKIKPEWGQYYATLLELRERLINQMSGLAKESAEEMPGYSLHMADSGTDNFDRDFALSLLSSDQDAIYEIEEALKRIEQGNYGNCFDCGEEIAEKRLRALPFAVRCKDCEEARETAEQRERQLTARRGTSSLFLDM